jgi:hypothetical protein
MNKNIFTAESAENAEKVRSRITKIRLDRVVGGSGPGHPSRFGGNAILEFGGIHIDFSLRPLRSLRLNPAVNKWKRSP